MSEAAICDNVIRAAEELWAGVSDEEQIVLLWGLVAGPEEIGWGGGGGG